MARFKLTISRMKPHYATLEVEADNLDEAKEMYYASHFDDDINSAEFLPDDCWEDEKLDSCEAIEVPESSLREMPVRLICDNGLNRE